MDGDGSVWDGEEDESALTGLSGLFPVSLCRFIPPYLGFLARRGETTEESEKHGEAVSCSLFSFFFCSCLGLVSFPVGPVSIC